MDALKESGGNPALDYLVPETVLKVKRMLVGLNAPGGAAPVLWVLDPRLGQDRYARAFQKALPHWFESAGDEAELVTKTLSGPREKPAAALEEAEQASPLVN